jgi:hypothetical protein
MFTEPGSLSKTCYDDQSLWWLIRREFDFD